MRTILNSKNEMKVGDDIYKYIDPCTCFIIHNENWALLSLLDDGNITNADLAQADLEIVKTGDDCGDCEISFYAQRTSSSELEYTFYQYSITGDLPGVSSYWDFGDGSNSTQSQPSHTFHNENTYDVTLVTSNSDCYSKIIFNLNVTASGCKADFKSKVDGKDVEFTDKLQPSNGGWLVTWDWDFDDGATSSLQNPSHTYFKAGKYEVKLTITDNSLCINTTDPPKKVKIKDEDDCCKHNGHAPDYKNDYDPNHPATKYLAENGWKENYVLFTTIGAKSKNFHYNSSKAKFKEDKADIIKAYIGGDVYYEDCESSVPISKMNPKTNDKCVVVNMNVWFDNSKIKKASLGCSHYVEDDGASLPQPHLRIIAPKCK